MDKYFILSIDISFPVYQIFFSVSLSFDGKIRFPNSQYSLLEGLINCDGLCEYISTVCLVDFIEDF